MKKNLSLILWILIAVFTIGLLFSKVILPTSNWLGYGLIVAILICLGFIVRENKDRISKRTATQGANSALTIILVLGILSLVNFFSLRNPQKFDVTKNQLNTFSDQSKKVLSEIQQDVTFSFFYSQPGELEQNRALLEDYQDLNPKLEIEYLQIEKNLERARAAELKNPTTLIIKLGKREKKIENLTEEQITNALIDLRKTKAQVVCTTVGHGEAPMSDKNQADSFASIVDQLESEAFEFKEWRTAQEKEPDASCSMIAILGPKKPFFKPELESLESYLSNGGSVLIALDVSLKGDDPTPGLRDLLKKYSISTKHHLILDPNPLNKMMGHSEALALVANFSKESPITKVFDNASGSVRNIGHFPFARPLMIIPEPPKTLKVTWLAQTMETSWAETNMKAIRQGRAQFNPDQDTRGPLTVAMAVSGKLKEDQKKDLKLVVFGSSLFANNKYSRFGINGDLFMNAVNWLSGDEDFITIRKKKDDPGEIQLSVEAGRIIFWISVVDRKSVV